MQIRDQINLMRATLRRRMIAYLALLVGGSVLMGFAAVMGVNRVHDDLDVALRGNQQLRQVYDVGMDVAAGRRSLGATPADTSAASVAIERGLAKLDMSQYDAAKMSARASAGDWLDESKRVDFQSRLRDVLHQLNATKIDSASSEINTLLGELSLLSSDTRSTIVAKQQAAEDERHRTLLLIVTLLAMVVLAAITIGVKQYQSVMQPLNRITRGVRNFAGGKWGERIPATGDKEFVVLANDFNRMAAELETLYRHLEEQVAIKSRELVRSERLASVGYLAAGVAHEMNNPLGIIAGYGERSLQHLANGLNDNTLSGTQRAIKIICEEAFRCKEITTRLLSLARPGGGDRVRVNVRSIVEDVISSLGGLPENADRKITLESPAGDDLWIMGSDGEIRQVVLNLMLNALASTLPAKGQVRVAISSLESEVEIAVQDNGCGMTAQTLDRVFEPFFTDRRGQLRPGTAARTGLGLSITHAIVLDHGGRISAHSAGCDTGSRFVVRFPSASEGAAVASAT